MQSPAPGEEQPQAPVPARDHPAGKQLGRRGPRDLVNIKMNISHKYALARKKTNGILGCIRPSTTNRLRKVIPPLYSAVVKPHLKCCVLWALKYKRDVDILERVQ